MKTFKSKILKSIPLILALSSCQNLRETKEASAPYSKAIVASYSDGVVTRQEVDYELSKVITKNDKLKNLTFDDLKEDQKEGLIKEVVLKNIAYKEAKKRKLNKDSDYQEALKLFESDLLKQKLLITLVKDAQDEKNVRKNYDELAEKIKDKKDFRISYIVVKNQNEANTIQSSLIKSPSSFAAQAKRKSIDKETAKKGGDLGFAIEDSLPVEALKEIKSLKKGEISKPVLVSGKWIIIKLEDERPAQIAPYEKAKDALAQNLARKAVEDFISRSLEKAKINMAVK